MICDANSVFEAAVRAVERRARHVLKNEARVGKAFFISRPSPPAEAGLRARHTRILQDELAGRLSRLHAHLLTWTSDTGAERAVSDVEKPAEALRRLVERVAALEIEDLPPAKWRDAVLHALVHLRLAMEDMEETLEIEVERLSRSLPSTWQPLLGTSTVAIEFLVEKADAYSLDSAARVAALMSAGQALRPLTTECRALLSGGFLLPKGLRRGQPEKLRGRWLAAHLIGVAEGFGLKPSRNHASKREKPLHSALDAYLAVREALARPEDPAARRMFDETPYSYDAAARLLRESDPERGSDPELMQAREIGRSVGATALGADPSDPRRAD